MNKASPSARGGAAAALRGHSGGRGMRARATTPLLGAGEPGPSWWALPFSVTENLFAGPSWRAFPFSTAENLFAGAMSVAASKEARKKKEQEEQRKRWVTGAPPPSHL